MILEIKEFREILDSFKSLSKNFVDYKRLFSKR